VVSSNEIPAQRLEWSSTPAGTVPFGVGFNWFDFFGMGGCYARSPHYPLDERVFPATSDANAWRALFAEITTWRPGMIRFGIPPDPHVAEDGTLVTDTVHLDRLELVADWAASIGCDILLDTYVIPETLGFAVVDGASGGDNRTCVNMAARDNRVYAERFVAPFLRHIRLERGLQAVRWFNPVNEPDHYGVYQVPAGGPDLYRHYVEMYSEMRRALDAAGLARDAIGLVGVDKDVPFDWPSFEYLQRGIDVDEAVDAYAFHSYRHRFDWATESPACPDSDPLATLGDRWIRRLASQMGARGKPLLAAEIGSFHYGWRMGDAGGPSTPDACILTAEAIIRFLNAGAAGAMPWSLVNPDNIDGTWSMLRWMEGGVLRTRHAGSTYALLMRHVPRGSRIHPLKPRQREYPQYVHGTLIRDESDHAHVLVVNDHPDSPREVIVSLPPDAPRGPWLRLAKCRSGLSASPAPPPQRTEIRDTLAPMSLHVYSSETDNPVLSNAT
jgi:hypothetical protein